MAGHHRSVLVAAAGVLAAGYVGVRAGGDRHKLEQELEQTYTRLRAAEAQARTEHGEAAEARRRAATARRPRRGPRRRRVGDG